jgi:hypothetical protein
MIPVQDLICMILKKGPEEMGLLLTFNERGGILEAVRDYRCLHHTIPINSCNKFNMSDLNSNISCFKEKELARIKAVQLLLHPLALQVLPLHA